MNKLTSTESSLWMILIAFPPVRPYMQLGEIVRACLFLWGVKDACVIGQC
jgi:hypothetical protein